jgi:hypothetical protein
LNSEIAPSFLALFRTLPSDVKTLARKNHRLWKRNPSHPSLRFKWVGQRTESYSVRVGKGWRVIGVKDNDTIVWFWIGSHADYDKIIDSL